MSWAAWQALAACSDPKIPTSVFFPDAEVGRCYDYSEAKAICAGCEVRAECLEAGIREHFGMWGGLLPVERARLLRARAKARRQAARDGLVVVEPRPCAGCAECEAS